MSEIKLTKRYPHSRSEDITDAYMRGFEDGMKMGRGECHDLAETPKYRDKTEFRCSECGFEYSAVGGFGCDAGDPPEFRFCPECGRKVVSE